MCILSSFTYSSHICWKLNKNLMTPTGTKGFGDMSSEWAYETKINVNWDTEVECQQSLDITSSCFGLHLCHMSYREVLSLLL